MKRIDFINNGTLNILGLVLMGGSTKRNDSTKIGHYGSGWKYAIAVLLRNKIPFKIFTGGKEVEISTRPVKIGDTEFEMVVVNNCDANFTTELGPDWTVWMALREIYCNCLDEPGSVTYRDDRYSIYQCAGITDSKTLVTVAATEEVQDIVAEWFEYFSFERTDDVLVMPGLKVYKALHNYKSLIYRKGIKVAESAKAGCYDYDFDDIPINEIRQAKSFDDIKDRLKTMMKYTVSIEVLNTILTSNNTWEKEIHFYSWESIGTSTKQVWKDVINHRSVVPTEYSDKLLTKDVDKDSVLIVPVCMAQLISCEMPDELVLGYDKGTNLQFPVKATDDQKARLKKAVFHLNEAGVECNEYLFEIVQFDNSYCQCSHACKQIFVSVKEMDKDYRDVARLLHREIILIRCGHAVYSRDLEDYLFNELYEKTVKSEEFTPDNGTIDFENMYKID